MRPSRPWNTRLDADLFQGTIMKILAARRPPPGMSPNLLGFVDLQLSPEVRIYDLRVLRSPGGLRVHSASARGSKIVTFTPAISEEIARLAGEALGEIARNDNRQSV